MKLIDIRIAWRVHGGWPGRSELMVDLGGSRSIARVACIALVLPLASCQSVHARPDDGKERQESVRLDGVPNDADRPQVAIDAAGTALAVWDQTNEGEFANVSDDIWSNQRQVGGPWGEAQHLAGIPLRFQDTLSPQIAAGGDGSAMVVFLKFDAEDKDYDVWAIRHAPDRGWDNEAVLVGEGPVGRFDAARPRVAADNLGNAVAVWEQQRPSAPDDEQGIWYNRYDSTRGVWTGQDEIRQGELLVSPRVGMDSNGNAIAVWEEVEDAVSSIRSRRITADGSLDDPLNVESFGGSAFDPQVAVDPQGDGIAVWTQQRDNSLGSEIQANRYVSLRGDWEEAVSVGLEGEGDAQQPQIAIDADGNAIVVWAQTLNEATLIWSNRFEVGIGWTGPVPIGPMELSSARTPQVAMSPDGDAVAVWVQFDGVQDSVWFARYLGGAWGMSEAIEGDRERRAFGPQVAIDHDGNAVAVWVFQDRNGRLAIWSSSLE